MNLRGLLSNIRIRCRNPRAQQPSDRTLLVLLSSHVQNLLIEANLRGRYWAVDETEVVVNPNVAEYIINVEGFGKPLEVRAVYAPGSSHIDHDVDFFELGDLNYLQDGYWGSGVDPLNGQPYGDQRVAFYRRNGNIYLRIAQGGPPAGTRYKIIYQVGKFSETTPLDEEVFLPEFSGLVEIRAAISALPHCDWEDNESTNERRRKELAMSLAEDGRIAYPLFKSWVGSMTAASQPTSRYLDPIDA